MALGIACAGTGLKVRIISFNRCLVVSRFLLKISFLLISLCRLSSLSYSRMIKIFAKLVLHILSSECVDCN